MSICYVPDPVLGTGDAEVSKTAHGADPFHGSEYSSPAPVLKHYHAEKSACKDSDCQAPLPGMACPEVQDVCVLSRCLTLCDPVDCGLPGFCVQGIF